jgi:HlyD family secretion protein
VLQILADAGDRVAAGQALARLDARQISADSELLSAQVRRARTALAEAEVGLTTARLSLTRAQSGADARESALSTDQAEIALRQAQSEFGRAAAVKEDGALSQEQTEARRAQADLAAARLRNQRADAAAIIESRRQGVAQAQARVEASRADLQVAIAQQAQSDSRQNNGLITAPVSGLVIARNVNVGEIAGSTGQPMFTIVSGNALELAAEVSEGDLGRLSLGMKAQFTAPDGTPVYGVLRRLPAQIDPTRRTGIARFTLDGNPSVKAGVFLTGSATASGRGVAAIPASSLVYGPEGASIFVLRSDDTVRKAPVVLGGRQGPLVELVNGPTLGTMIVTSGSSFLAEGEKVNPVRGAANAAAAPAAKPAPSNVPTKN